jgi:hypothetical protein
MADKFEHLWMPSLIARAFHKNKVGFPFHCGEIKLPLRGRYSLVVFISIFMAENPHIHIKSLNFCQVDLISPAISSREFLKQKNIKETSE